MSARAYNSSQVPRSTSGNPFEDDKDDDKYSFGNRRAAESNKSEEDQMKQYKMRIGHIENESLESTYRALRSINESHEIGVKTAEELVAQGEKLSNINDRLDEVDNTLNATQKNINSLKSVFGGLRNKFFSGSSNNTKSKSGLTPSSSSNSMSGGNLSGQASAGPRPQFVPITGSDREQEIGKNMDELSIGLGNLKQLAMGMNQELKRQEPIVDNLTIKTDRTHVKILEQEKQMKKVLKS